VTTRGRGPTELPVTLMAPAKLTLSLRIVGVRDDGYHLVDAEMVSVDLIDDIELSVGSGVEVVGASGLDVPIGADNLVSRALDMVGVSAHASITKRIPAGAGLGGGSTDAAAVLAWAGVSDPLAASQLGADVGFCLAGGRARVSGIGDHIEPLDPIPASFTLLTPPFGVSTPVVYAAWDQLGGPQGTNGSDLEPAALLAYPALSVWRDALSEVAGSQARLAGSGGTWFVEGAFDGSVLGVTLCVVHTLPARNHLRRGV